MGSHFGAVGMPASLTVADVISALVPKASSQDDGGAAGASVHTYTDPSGSRAAITAVDGSITCLTPSIVPGHSLSVTLGSLAADACPFERPLLFEVLADEEVVYPLAAIVEDLAISEPLLALGERDHLEISALAEQISFYADEAAYQAAHRGMAPRSLIPAGLFSLDPGPHVVTPRILMSGEVLGAEMRHHELFEQDFGRLLVGSYGADYVVGVDPVDLAPFGEERLPAIGSIVSGTFWLSGRRVQPIGGVQ